MADEVKTLAYAWARTAAGDVKLVAQMAYEAGWKASRARWVAVSPGASAAFERLIQEAVLVAADESDLLAAVEVARTWLESDEEEMLGTRDAAARLGVHENTIRNWESRGLLPSTKKPGPSGYLLFKASDLDARLAESMEEDPDA